MYKQITYKIRGMNRDLSESVADPQFAFDIQNMRLMTSEDNTLLSLVNEKGTKQLEIQGISESVLEGVPIGQIVLEDEMVVFTTNGSVNPDRIYKFWFDKDDFKGILLYQGNLNFNTDNPIEGLGFFENDNLKKIYWTDGRNQPRFINLAATTEEKLRWDNTSFNFIRELELKENITIEKVDISNGEFAPGVLQYHFTYFNKYGQESNIFYSSPLLYTSHINRGGNPEETVSNSFKIRISGIDDKFDYIRIYSTLRTSIDNNPFTKKVIDLTVKPGATEIIYIDNGINGNIIDPLRLFYIGGEEAIYQTISHKDNTLFLGNVSVKRKFISDIVKDYFKSAPSKAKLTFTNNNPLKVLTANSLPPSGYYPYKNQLKENAYKFKTFKYLEYYRFGIQFQHKSGRWSEPIYICDKQNTAKIKTDLPSVDGSAPASNTVLSSATYTLDNLSIIQNLVSNNFVKVRPVVVYPQLNDREVLCQGVLCPTVYNVQDRYNNSPFAQSSWFTRPLAPFDKVGNLSNYTDLITGSPNSLYSKAGYFTNDLNYTDPSSPFYSLSYDKPLEILEKGSLLEFRHNYKLPDNLKRNSEIQCIPANAPEKPYVDGITSGIASYVKSNQQNFYVDQSILTFHSPDIEFDSSLKSISDSLLKLRIVGIVPITANVSDLDIQTSTPPRSSKSTGHYNVPIGRIENISIFGARSMAAGVFWMDRLSTTNAERDVVENPSEPYEISLEKLYGFLVYPWHRNGSLNNAAPIDGVGRPAFLSKKKMSNLKYSYNTIYYDDYNIWKAYEEVDGEVSTTNTGISGVGIFNSNEISILRLPKPKNSQLNDINYYGNIDKVVNLSRAGDNKDGYSIVKTGHTNYLFDQEDFSTLFTSLLLPLSAALVKPKFWPIYGTEPIRIKYKSSPHAVIALNYTTDGHQRVLPTTNDDIYSSGFFAPGVANSAIETGVHPFWEKESLNISQDMIHTPNVASFPTLNNIGYGFLWLAELYNDEVINRFGGTSEEAFENNQWVPCGEAVPLVNSSGNPVTSVIIDWIEGDTYFQRYDHLKTYAFTQEDQNSIVDIISFMCETRVNLDGRYDRNRGLISNIAVSPTNFNLLNKVYSQPNSFFNYRVVNPSKLNLDYFPNTITWTLPKTLGDLIDSWTNVTLAATLDLDGDKGILTALRRFNNEMYAFQEKAIANILYNSRTMISSTDGLPIELANSAKVDGKRYISYDVGCSNKWSITETPSGLYFMDNLNKGIYYFNGQLEQLSNKLGFHSWMTENNFTEIWNPIDFNNFVTYYDRTNREVLFISDKTTLAYSELLQSFTSFYSYENTPYFTNFGNERIWIAKSRVKDSTKYKLWLHQKGDYNYYFDKYDPYYVTVIVNPEPFKDKIFNTLEFRADSFDSKSYRAFHTFDKLNTWNEYQQGETLLSNVKFHPSSLKKKFKIWRVNIPRDKVFKRDRMRNPWLYVKLSKDEESDYKTILHDLTISYF